MKTSDEQYTAALRAKQGVWWKRLLNVQAPYAWNVRRLGLGFVLDVGCGIGRNLLHLNGNGVGVDHNAASVATARERGLTAFTPDAFLESEYNTAGRFDSLLLAHVAERMREAEVVSVVRSYVALVRPGGRVVFITPQERGYRTDATHVQFMDFDALGRIGAELGLEAERDYSFPFPRAAGRVFVYNEFVSVKRRPNGGLGRG